MCFASENIVNNNKIVTIVRKKTHACLFAYTDLALVFLTVLFR